MVASLTNAAPRKTEHSLNVVVIGGSSGIGRAIVEGYAKLDCRIFATYYCKEEGIVSLQKKYPGLIDYGHLDQGDLDSIEAFGDKIKEWLDNSYPENAGNRRVDILINNAALGSATVVKYVRSKLATEGKLESFLQLSQFRQQAVEDEALMRVNSLGPLWVTDIIFPLLRNQATATMHRNFGSIVFMGSVGGSTGVFPQYRASDLMSKAAVTYLSKHLAAENSHSQCDVFCLAPGATNTEMFQSSTLNRMGASELSRFLSGMPKCRLIEPEEIASAVVALTTEKWGRIFHGAVMDASLGLGVRPGLQTEAPE
eukprot:TRINITY_DN2564_c0_g1_i1.p1 TRINITY_DN2564_c0_g1~~TRINITY_DN2564_c0_g1_i1.p1  ORF type:complete len:312 (+),score=44.39 TRINITY_DN2564_c0_g1_i1:98-1033(+)